MLEPCLVFRLVMQLRHKLNILDQRAVLSTEVVLINIFDFRGFEGSKPERKL